MNLAPNIHYGLLQYKHNNGPSDQNSSMTYLLVSTCCFLFLPSSISFFSCTIWFWRISARLLRCESVSYPIAFSWYLAFSLVSLDTLLLSSVRVVSKSCSLTRVSSFCLRVASMRDSSSAFFARYWWSARFSTMRTLAWVCRVVPMGVGCSGAILS